MKSIIERIKELNFPADQYVVVGSGTLDALGIRRASDIDIAVLPELHKKLCESNDWEKIEKYGKVFLKADIKLIDEYLLAT